MAKPRKPAPAAADAVEVVEVIDTGDELQSALNELYAHADAAPTEALAHVYYIDADGEEAKIWKGEISEYDLDSLARQHGSGKYRLRVYVKTEAGNFGQKLDKVFPYRLPAEVDARLRAIRKGEIQPQAAQGGAPALTAEQIGLAVAAAIKAALPVQAPINQLGMLQEVAQIVRTLHVAPTVNNTQPAVNPMEMLRLGVELARGNSGGDDDAPPRSGKTTAYDLLARMVDRFAPAFIQAAQQSQGGNGAAPAQIADSTTVQAAGDKMSAENEAIVRLRAGLDFLIMQAQADNDPETYAGMVMDNIPEADLIRFINGADPIAYLANVHPGVRQHEKWFKDLLQIVKEEMTAPPDQGGEVDGPAKTH